MNGVLLQIIKEKSRNNAMDKDEWTVLQRTLNTLCSDFSITMNRLEVQYLQKCEECLYSNNACKQSSDSNKKYDLTQESLPKQGTESEHQNGDQRVPDLNLCEWDDGHRMFRMEIELNGHKKEVECGATVMTSGVNRKMHGKGFVKLCFVELLTKQSFKSENFRGAKI